MRNFKEPPVSKILLTSRKSSELSISHYSVIEREVNDTTLTIHCKVEMTRALEPSLCMH